MKLQERPDQKSIIWANRVISNRRLLMIGTISFSILGLLIAFFLLENEYESKMQVLPEINSAQGSTSELISTFGGLSGINLSGMLSNDSYIPPELYTNVVNSTPFLLQMLKKDLTINGDPQGVVLLEYFDERETSVVIKIFSFLKESPWLIWEALKGEDSGSKSTFSSNTGNTIKLTKEEEKWITILKSRIVVYMNVQTGLLNITTRMPDPDLAMLTTLNVYQELIQYIEDYRQQKARKEYDFILNEYAKQKEEFEQIQQELASFQDNNLNQITSSSRIRERALQSKYDLHFQLYTTLANQLEQSKIDLNKNTPLFKILEPANFPLKKASPKRLLILFLSAALGFMFSMGYIFLLPGIKSTYKQIVGPEI